MPRSGSLSIAICLALFASGCAKRPGSLLRHSPPVAQVAVEDLKSPKLSGMPEDLAKNKSTRTINAVNNDFARNKMAVKSPATPPTKLIVIASYKPIVGPPPLAANKPRSNMSAIASSKPFNEPLMAAKEPDPSDDKAVVAAIPLPKLPDAVADNGGKPPFVDDEGLPLPPPPMLPELKPLDLPRPLASQKETPPPEGKRIELQRTTVVSQTDHETVLRIEPRINFDAVPELALPALSLPKPLPALPMPAPLPPAIAAPAQPGPIPEVLTLVPPIPTPTIATPPTPAQPVIAIPTTPPPSPQPAIKKTNAQVAVQEMSVDALVAEVLANNPSLAQMEAAWQAASARYPQVHAFDDPMLSGAVAPASFGSNNVEPGYRIELAQKIPVHGKRKLRGDGALAETSAARNDADDMRAQLIESAKLAFYDYYLVTRATEVNLESIKLLKDFRESADSRYRTGLVPQQDVLQADVEIGRQTERGLTLERMRRVAIARINTLRNMPVQSPLLAAPRNVTVYPSTLTADELSSYALTQRADLRALQDRVVADQAALALTAKEYWPDLEISGAYDTIMGNGPARDLAPQIGMRLNIPVQLSRRNAAVAEAQAKIAQRRAEANARANQIQFQVQEAFAQVQESERILDLYDKTILPAARENVKSAQSAYVTGKIAFLALVDAQRNLVNLRDRFYEATADYHRRLASLERAVGGPLPTK